MGAVSPWHWLIVILVLVVLFGAKRLPDASRSIGRSLRIFKSEMKDMTNDEKAEPAGATSPPPAAAPQQLPPAPAPQDTQNTQHVQAERIKKAG